MRCARWYTRSWTSETSPYEEDRDRNRCFGDDEEVVFSAPLAEVALGVGVGVAVADGVTSPLAAAFSSLGNAPQGKLKSAM